MAEAMLEERAMFSQVNNRNSIPIVGYMERHYPKINLQNEIIGPLQKEYNFFVKSPTGLEVPLNAEHLNDIDIWMSNFAYDRIYNKIAEVTDNPGFGYSMGRESMIYHPQLRFFGPLLGVQGIVERVPAENEKWNRTKRIVIVENSPGHFVVGYQHFKKLDGKDILVSEIAKDYHYGLGDATAEIAGQIGESMESRLRDGITYPFIGKPDPNEGVYFEYEGKYKPRKLFNRARFYYFTRNIADVKATMEDSRQKAIREKEAAVRERIQKEKEAKIRMYFQKFVSTKLVDDILFKGKAPRLGLDEEYLSVMFSDIRDFTTLSEEKDGVALTDLLEDYLNELSWAIESHNGYTQDYIGDAVMNLFESASDAVSSAVDMRIALRSLNNKLESRGIDPLRTGIGIATGRMRQGIIGTENRMKETVIGDFVNTASRLEAATKEYNIPIIIDGNTYQDMVGTGKVADPSRNGTELKEILEGRKILTRLLGSAILKGKRKPTEMYEVIPYSYSPEVIKLRMENDGLYRKALRLSMPKSGDIEIIRSSLKNSIKILKIISHKYRPGMGFNEEDPGGDRVCDRKVEEIEELLRKTKTEPEFFKNSSWPVKTFKNK